MTALPTRRILITGASAGIGRAAAGLLAGQGHRIILAARNRPRLELAVAEIAREGGQASALVMDVTDDDSVHAAIAALEADGGCEVLVNNAGMSVQAEFMRQSPDARRAEMELNYFGAQRVAAAVLPGMLRRKRGKIVNVSSLLGYVACPTSASYCASKAALNAWSRALHLELKRFGVDVQVFVAPHTQTALGDATRYDGVRKLPAAYVAAELATAIAGRRREYAASPVYRMLLQVARFFPGFIEARVANSTRSLLASSWDPNAPA